MSQCRMSTLRSLNRKECERALFWIARALTGWQPLFSSSKQDRVAECQRSHKYVCVEKIPRYVSLKIQLEVGTTALQVSVDDDRPFHWMFYILKASAIPWLCAQQNFSRSSRKLVGCRSVRFHIPSVGLLSSPQSHINHHGMQPVLDAIHWPNSAEEKFLASEKGIF